jgi:hypothetical protein
MLEKEIQAKITSYLKKNNWMVLNMQLLSLNGLPDLLCLNYNIALWIEVKRPKKKPTELQKFRHAQLRNFGFTVIVADNLKVVKDYVSQLKIKP